MKTQLLIYFLIICISLEETDYEKMWTSFPACRMGRLQSPVRLNITQSVYNSIFSIVYQQFSSVQYTNSTFNESQPVFSASPPDNSSQYINFQKGGVIKQYNLERLELYQGLHKVEEIISEYELHFVFKKVLGFTTNQNQYRRIQDANNYLVLVVRYNSSGGMNDNGLYACVFGNSSCDLTNYPIFQDKRAFYYEGSFIYNPCQEDVNYIVLYDLFKADISNPYTNNHSWAKRDFSYSYDRPIYRNFMNYTESLSSSYLDSWAVLLFSMFFILF